MSPTRGCVGGVKYGGRTQRAQRLRRGRRRNTKKDWDLNLASTHPIRHSRVEWMRLQAVTQPCQDKKRTTSIHAPFKQKTPCNPHKYWLQALLAFLIFSALLRIWASYKQSTSRPASIIPALAGIHVLHKRCMDSRLRGNDDGEALEPLKPQVFCYFSASSAQPLRPLRSAPAFPAQPNHLDAGCPRATRLF